MFRVFRGPNLHSGTPSGVLTMVGGVPGVFARYTRSTPGCWLTALRAVEVRPAVLCHLKITRARVLGVLRRTVGMTRKG
jgi:hypothetical protein